MGPIEWVRECSEARGSEWALLLALAERAVGCVAEVTSEQAIKDGHISRSQLYKCLGRLGQMREVERLLKPSDNKRVRAFHLRRFCESPLNCDFSPLCPRKQRRVSDLRDWRHGTDAEGCLLCRGTGWKLVPRWRVGMPGQGEVVVKCRAHVKQLPLLEIPAVSWAPAITPEVLSWRSWQLKASA